MNRRYKIRKSPRKRRLTRSNAGPLLALLGTIFGALAVIAAIVIFVVPFAISLFDKSYVSPFMPQPTPAPTAAPTPSPNPIECFVPGSDENEIVLSSADYKWFGDPCCHNGKIVFTAGKLKDNNAAMSSLFFYEPETRTATSFDYTLKYDHFMFPSFNDEWLVFIDTKFGGGGSIMAARLDKEGQKAFKVKDFYVGQPEIKLWEHYIVWTERTGSRMDKLFVCDLETLESTTLVMFNGSSYGQSIPSFMNGLIVWADASAVSPDESAINYMRLSGRLNTYTVSTYVHDPEGNGAYFAWLDAHHSRTAKLYGSKSIGKPRLIAEGAIEFGLYEDYVIYSKDESIWAYSFETDKSYRITPENESAQFMGVSGGMVFFMDVTSRERDILKYVKLP